MLTTLLTFLPLALAAPQVAFPGAEGLGRFATGGRTGTNYVVSTLADSGTGSLRDALSQPNRIITFNVSGVIHIKKRLVIPKATTILGQTAPGVGITTYGNGWSGSGASDSIVRYIRVRMGAQGDKGKDAMTIANGQNMIFDHVTYTWGRDETFSINAYEKAANITIQDCIVAQGLQTHSAGGLMQVKAGLSLFRNLWADNKTRNPKVKGRNDFVNNVIYNWGGGGGYIAGGSEGDSVANIVGNYFVAGPSTGKTKAFVRGNEHFKASVKGNYVDHNKDGVLNGEELKASSDAYGGMAVVATDMGFPGPEKVMSAPEAIVYVLKNAGASKVRDANDEQLIKEVMSYGKSGKLIHDESETVWGMAFGAGKKAPEAEGNKTPEAESKENWAMMADSDGDGIPDWYEIKMGWDVNGHDAMKIQDSGYTRIEEYANSLLV
ncbi:fibronectin [Microthyrium microscopicum]|uniref:Probable pectate lyase C n=1 Tax=Microthyrium microscopicum TaxID=703497 RepID=A0A6A6UCR5_9PEZI|nr:fibronectin [Microthyrium microscopicum]